MNNIQENREKLKSIDVSMVDCIKVGTYGNNTSAIYAYLVSGEKLQVSRPIFNFMVQQNMAKDFVTKNIEPLMKRRLTTMGGGLACVNLQNVQSFEVEPCRDRVRARVDAKFKSGRNSFLYTVPVTRMFDEQDKLTTMLGLTPDTSSAEEF